MNKLFSLPVVFLAMVTGSTIADEDIVIRDGEVAISREEMAAALALVPESFRASAANDLGDRLELINSLLQTRKMAAEADALDPQTDGYWKLQFELLAMKRNFFYEIEQRAVSVPDADNLAREYYETQKDKYALVPEYRASSHILFAARPGIPRDEIREKAKLFLEELRAGASFEEYVEKYSDDVRSKARGGALTESMKFGDPRFSPPYSEALFEIDEVGGYSKVTDTQFGVHIIRLDAIEPSHYLDFDEVKNKILQDIVTQYKSLAAKEIAVKYNITDDAFIDGDAMEELFAPYKSE